MAHQRTRDGARGGRGPGREHQFPRYSRCLRELSERGVSRPGFESRWKQVVITTKFGSKMDDDLQGASPDYIWRAVDASLRRLGTDRIDLYQPHQPDPKTPIGDTLDALDKLVKSGKVRETGVSNFSVEQIFEAEAAVRDGAARFVNVQNE